MKYLILGKYLMTFGNLDFRNTYEKYLGKIAIAKKKPKLVFIKSIISIQR